MRRSGKTSLLTWFIGRLRYFHADALSRPCRIPALFDFSNVEYLAGLYSRQPLHELGGLYHAAAQIIFRHNLSGDQEGSEGAGQSWNATTIEWSVPSPPPFDNFAGVHPVVKTTVRMSIVSPARRRISSCRPILRVSVTRPDGVKWYGWINHSRISFTGHRLLP